MGLATGTALHVCVCVCVCVWRVRGPDTVKYVTYKALVCVFVFRE